MAENPFAQFAVKTQDGKNVAVDVQFPSASNPFAQFAPAATPAGGIPGPRRGYSLTEVPVEAVKNLAR